MIEDFGGIARVMPVFAVFFVISALSSIGVPGLNGFVGEFTILVGAFGRHPVFTVGAALGVVLAAVYMFWMLQRVLFNGNPAVVNLELRDLNVREWCVLVPLVFLMFGLGLYPKPFMRTIEPSAKKWLRQVNRRVITVKVPLPKLASRRIQGSRP